MSDRPIRLILADDHPIVLHGLQQLFERERDFVVVASCRNGEEALQAARTKPADVLVLDLRMPDKSGLDVMRAVVGEKIPCKVVILTATMNNAQMPEVLQAGARGFVFKESTPAALVDCVRRVHQGELWIDSGAMSQVVNRIIGADGRAQSPPPKSTLTLRELEIVRMVGLGLRNKEIGERLSISEGTVKIHLHHVYEKLGVDGRLELVLYAQEQGWI